MKMKLHNVINIAFLSFCFVGSASAINLTFDGSSISSNTPHTGASASVDITFTDASLDDIVTMNLAIENTTGDSIFGAGATTSVLTGVALNLPSGVTAIANTFSGNANFDTFLTSVNAQPFPNFDNAFADNDNYNGGNANQALAQDGGIVNVSVDLDFGALTSVVGAENAFNTFISGFSPANDNNGPFYAAVRFQQVNAGSGSDKLAIPGPNSNPVNTPDAGSTLALMGIALAGLGALKRRK